MVRDEVEFTQYTQRGQRRYEFYAQAVGGDSSGIARKHSYDAAGQLLETRRYFELGTTKEVWVAPVDRPPGEYTPEMVDVGGWLMYSETYRYDADGRLRWQETRGRETNARLYMGSGGGGDQYDDTSLLRLNSRVEYTLADGTDSLDDNASAYDAAGRLTSYRYTGTGAGAPSGFTHTFTMTYEGWGSWQEVRVQGISSVADYKATTNTISLDAFGRITQQSEHTDAEGVKDTIRAYTYNADGAVLTRRHGYWDQYFRQATKPDANNTPIPQNYRMVHAAGQQVAELEAGGEVRVSLPSARLAVGDTTATAQGKRSRMSEMNGVAGSGPYSAGGGLVAVMEGETLQGLAQRIYGNAAMWYLLADANGMDSATAQLTAGTRLKAPAVSVNRNDANTFKPYNPSEAIGSTTPSLPYIPPPQEAGCNTMAMIIMVVIAVVVTMVTWGVLSGFTWGALGTATTTVGGAMATGAVSAAAGSIVSQGIGSLEGVSSFSWRQVGVDAVVGGLMAGAGMYLKSGGKAPFTTAAEQAGIGPKQAAFANKYGSLFVNPKGQLTSFSRVTQGVLGYAGTVAGNAAFGRDTNFSWKSVATSALGAYVGSKINPNGSYPITDGSTSMGRIINASASNFVDGALSATLTRMAGGEKQNWTSIAINAVASAAGAELGDGILKAREDGYWMEKTLSRIQEVAPGYELDESIPYDQRKALLEHHYAYYVEGKVGSGAERFRLPWSGNGLGSGEDALSTDTVNFAQREAQATSASATTTTPVAPRSFTLSPERMVQIMSSTVVENGLYYMFKSDGTEIDTTGDRMWGPEDIHTIIAGRDGSLQFSGNGLDILKYLKARNPRAYAEAADNFAYARYNREALQTGYETIPFGSSPFEAQRVVQFNHGVHDQRWADYRVNVANVRQANLARQAAAMSTEGLHEDVSFGWLNTHNQYLDGMFNAPTLGGQAMGFAGALATSPVALVDMALSSFLNTPDTVVEASQEVRKGDFLWARGDYDGANALYSSASWKMFEATLNVAGPPLGTYGGRALNTLVRGASVERRVVVAGADAVADNAPLSQAAIRARVEANVAQTRAGIDTSRFEKLVQSEGRLYEQLDIWPPNLGRVGPVEVIDLQPGAIIDRFGLPNGRFLSPQGTPFSARALPSTYEARKPFFMYEVIKPIPGVTQSRALPWFGQRGMGVQYELPRGINYLDPNNGYVRVKYHEP